MQFEASARALEALQIGDKLWVAPDDTLAVDVPWVGQPVARLISGNSRVRTLDTLRAFATNAPVSALTPKAIAGVRTLSLTYIMNGDAAIAEQLNAAADTMYARVRDAMPPVAVFDSCVASAVAAAAATDTATVTATAAATDTPAVTATAAAAATDISTVTVTAAATDTPAVTATAMAAATDTPAVTATDFMPQPCAAAGPDGGSAGGSDDDDGSDPGSDDDDGSDSDSGSDPGSDDDGATDPGAELPCTAAVAAAAPETSDERSEVTALEALPEPSPEPCACLSARPHSPLAASTYTYRRQKRYQLSYAHQGWSAEY